MTEDNSQQTKPKFSRKHIITYSILGTLLIIIALAFGLPFLATDGTEKFSGKEQQIAKEAIGDGSYEGPDPSPITGRPLAFRAKVTAVYKQDPEKRCGIKSQDEGSVYIVEIDRVTFFGMLAPGYDRSSCELDE